MLATPAAARLLARRSLAPAMGATRSINLEAYEDYGKSVFAGKVAEEYMQKQGVSADILKDPSWVKTHADTVAKAVLDWYVRIFYSWRWVTAYLVDRSPRTAYSTAIALDFDWIFVVEPKLP